MTIVCGTDFTEPAGRAVGIAALLAGELGRPLHLVHVLDRPEGASEEIQSSRRRLEDEGRRVGARCVQVTTEVATGVADEKLVAIAAERSAHLIVVAALGRRSPAMWSLGSTADRVAQTAKAPVLVVRKPEPLEQWLARKRELCVAVAVEATPASDAAVRRLDVFSRHHTTRIVAVHVYWPPEQNERRRKSGRGESEAVVGSHPEIERDLAAELAPRLAALAPDRKPKLRLVGGLGRIADHLVQAAEEEGADLLVVGNHQRKGMSRFWHGSVSHDVIERAPCSVLCVPSGG